MNAQQFARKIDEIMRRLDALEASAHIIYNKGTYVPTYVGGTTAGATTYTFQSATWRKKGSELTVIGQINWSAATGTGEARFSLPFAPATYNASGSAWISGVTFANSTPVPLASVGNLYFVLDSPLTNAGNGRVQVEAAGSIIWCISYFV